MKNNKLLLDDIRDIEMVISYKKDPEYSQGEWDLVKNYSEFVDYILTNGLPQLISFDHDLADEHYTPSEYWDDYDLSKEYQDGKSYREKTGNDCAKWLVEYCLDNKHPLPKCLVHSMNPVGADYIKKTLSDYYNTVTQL